MRGFKPNPQLLHFVTLPDESRPFFAKNAKGLL